MALLSQQGSVGAPSNITSGDFMWTVAGAGVFACGGTPAPIVYDDSLVAQGLGEGRWVAVKANSITGYAGADVTAPTGFKAVAVSQENVNFAGTSFPCVVVTLAKA